ncbi:histidine phosphatase family protein [Maridesulfovibrio zosterae]|uniref:histidine phosphatase family protein n=1 Tax=Maridesulfovibrio zosterae TaxID=82171 RepID=UPI000403E0D8|nr:histidine phosphatase family protein [Maridesulfovibrio zosterae]
MIVLVRHGETENAKGKAIGHTDLQLSSTGNIQAQMLAESLKGVKFKTFLTSPLTRTMQTAAYIEKSCRITPTPRAELMEINLGKWDGLSYHKIKEKFPDEYAKRGQDFAGYRPPDGENFMDLKKRIKSFLDEFSKKQQPALIITHAGVIRIFMHLVLGFPLENIFCIKPSHCHVTIMTDSPSGYILKAFNLPYGPDLSLAFREAMP